MKLGPATKLDKRKETKSKKFEDEFIYLLTLFNVDYKTLAVYALIKIDYPPPPPPPLLP